MIFDARKTGRRGAFVREDDGRVVRWVVWYDDETTEFEAFRADPSIAARLGVSPASLRYRGHARLRFIPGAPMRKPTPTDERDAAGAVREAKLLWCKPVLMLPGRECEERYCHRLAEYQTAHERVIEPVVGADGRAYKRGIVTEVHSWCAWHYRAPHRIDGRGVESETEVATRPN